MEAYMLFNTPFFSNLVLAHTELSLLLKGYIVFHIKMYPYIFNQFLFDRYLLHQVFFILVCLQDSPSIPIG